MRHARGIERSARVLYAASTTSVAVALLVGSPLTRVIGMFFMGLNRPATPTRLFTSEPEALAWLRTFVA